MELLFRSLICIGFLMTSSSNTNAKDGYIEGSIRKKSGLSIEIYHNEEWRFVCGDSWKSANSKVACKMLGYKSDVVTMTFDKQHINESKWIKNLRCNGNEDNIDECEKDSWLVDGCVSTITVMCIGKSEGTSCGGRTCEPDKTFCCKNKNTDYCCDDVSVSPLKPPTHKTTTVAVYEDDGDSGLRYIWIGSLIGVIAIGICTLITVCNRKHRLEIQRSLSVNRTNTSTVYANRTTVLPSDDPPAYSTISSFPIKKRSHPCYPQNGYPKDLSTPPPPYTVSSSV